MPTEIKPAKREKDIETANKLLSKLRQIDRREHLVRLEKMFLDLKEDIKKATNAWKNQHGWTVNSPYEKLQKKVSKLIDEFGADMQIDLDKKTLPQIYKDEWNQKQFWASHFIAVKVRPAAANEIDVALRTLPQYGKPLDKMTVSKSKSTVELWLEALLPPMHGEINGKFKTLLFVETEPKTFFNWLDRFFQEKIDLNIGKIRGKNKNQEGVLDDLMFHVGQIAWQQKLSLVNPKLEQPVLPKDVSREEVRLHEFEVGFDTVTEYKDLVIRVVTLDERTCMECAPLDGMIFEESKAPTLIHHLCRCYNVPYFPGKMGALETGNYEPWFAKQSKPFQEKALGKRKWLLYDKGVPLRHLRGTWKEISAFFKEQGLFTTDDISAIDAFIRSSAAQTTWIKNKLTYLRELERELAAASSDELRSVLRAEIKDLKASVKAREATFKDTTLALEKALEAIPTTKFPGDVPYDEIGRLGVSVDEYKSLFSDMQKVFRTLKSKVESASDIAKSRTITSSRKKLDDYFSDLPKKDRELLDRDWKAFDTALENLA